MCPLPTPASSPQAAFLTDLVSFIPPPLVHPIGLLRGEQCHVVPIGLCNKRLLHWVKSQAGARVPLLQVKRAEGNKREMNSAFIVTGGAEQKGICMTASWFRHNIQTHIKILTLRAHAYKVWKDTCKTPYSKCSIQLQQHQLRNENLFSPKKQSKLKAQQFLNQIYTKWTRMNLVCWDTGINIHAGTLFLPLSLALCLCILLTHRSPYMVNLVGDLGGGLVVPGDEGAFSRIPAYRVGACYKLRTTPQEENVQGLLDPCFVDFNCLRKFNKNKKHVSTLSLLKYTKNK